MRTALHQWLVWVAIATPLLLSYGCLQPSSQNADLPNADASAPMPPGSMPEAVHNQVMAVLSADIGVPEEQLNLMRDSQETWSDSCLGLGGPNELCAQALVEGWQVEVVDTVTQRSYIYRTNYDGSVLRQATSWFEAPAN